jgi:hypothetical protein
MEVLQLGLHPRLHPHLLTFDNAIFQFVFLLLKQHNMFTNQV